MSRYNLPPMKPETIAETPDWMARAACRGANVEVFFPPHGMFGYLTGAVTDARAICAACPVRNDCLDYACEHNIEYGIWGGLVVKERREYKRRKREEGAA